MSVDRINFIQKSPWTFTYGRIVFIGGLAFGLCLLLSGGQFGRGWLLERRAVAITGEIEALKIQREKMLEEISRKTGGGLLAAQEKLREPFEKAPDWSALLKMLSLDLPPSVWIESLKTNDKPEASSGRGVILEGRASRAQAISELVETLSKSELFGNVVLGSSRSESGGDVSIYRFTLEAHLKKGGRG